MPKESKSPSVWEADLRRLAATGAQNLGKGGTPSAGTFAYEKYHKILKCKKHGFKKGVQRGIGSFFGSSHHDSDGCSCGYHVLPSQSGRFKPNKKRGNTIPNPYQKQLKTMVNVQPAASTPNPRRIVPGASFVTTPSAISVSDSGSPSDYSISASPMLPSPVSPPMDNTVYSTGSCLPRARWTGSTSSNDSKTITSQGYGVNDVRGVIRLVDTCRMAHCTAPKCLFERRETVPPPKPSYYHYSHQCEYVDLLLFGPTGGRCPACKGADLIYPRLTKAKFVHRFGDFPYEALGVEVKCQTCSMFTSTLNQDYIMSLPLHLRNQMQFISRGKSDGIDMCFVQLLRTGSQMSPLIRQHRNLLWKRHSTIRSAYIIRASEAVRNSQNAARFGGGIGATKPLRKFSPFEDIPERWVPNHSQLLRAFLYDFEYQKPALLREMQTIRSTQSLAADHQRKVAKRVKGTDNGRMSFVVVGDAGLILNYVFVPSTANYWSNAALDEVVKRHGDSCPKTLWVDCGCCNGKLGCDRKKKAGAAFWTTHLVERLDPLHVLMRITRACCQEHVRYRRFVHYMRLSLFVRHPDDLKALRIAQERSGLVLSAKERKSDESTYCRRMVATGSDLATRWLKIMMRFIRLDNIAQERSTAGPNLLQTLQRADMAYPLMTHQVQDMIKQQVVHCLNGCLDGDDTVTHVHVGKRKYRSTSTELDVYQSRSGTCGCETWHSSIDRAFYNLMAVRPALADAIALWRVTAFNRRKLVKMNHRDVLPEGVSCLDSESSLVLTEEEAKALPNVYFGFDYYNKVLSDFDKEKYEANGGGTNDAVPVLVENDTEVAEDDPANDAVAVDEIAAAEMLDLELANDDDDLATLFTDDDVVSLPAPTAADAEGVDPQLLQQELDLLELEIGATDTGHTARILLAELERNRNGAKVVNISRVPLSETSIESPSEGISLQKSGVSPRKAVHKKAAFASVSKPMHPDYNEDTREAFTEEYLKVAGKKKAATDEDMRTITTNYNKRALENSRCIAEDIDDSSKGLFQVQFPEARAWIKAQESQKDEPARQLLMTGESLDIRLLMDKDVNDATNDPSLVRINTTKRLSEVSLLDKRVKRRPTSGTTKASVASLPQHFQQRRHFCLICKKLIGAVSATSHPKGECPDAGQINDGKFNDDDDAEVVGELTVGVGETEEMIQRKVRAVAKLDQQRIQRQEDNHGRKSSGQPLAGWMKCQYCERYVKRKNDGHIFDGKTTMFCQFADPKSLWDDLKREEREYNAAKAKRSRERQLKNTLL